MEKKKLEEENARLREAVNVLVKSAILTRSVIAIERLFGKTEFDDVDEDLGKAINNALTALNHKDK